MRTLSLAVLATLLAASGCEQPNGYLGPTVRLTGDHLGWSKGAEVPELEWDGAHYTGTATLPGDLLSLRLFAPRTGMEFGAALPHSEATTPAAVPTTLALLGESPDGEDAMPLKLLTPLPTRYQLDFDPQRKELHIDLASNAEAGQSEAAALLITALRGSDAQPVPEQQRRADELDRAYAAMGLETPLRSPALSPTSTTPVGVTFLHFGPVERDQLSVVGDFNRWTTGRDKLATVLGGRLAYLAKQVSGTRIEYRFDRGGARYPDPRNLEVAWDGAYLPPNPQNLLGGNQGELNSVAFAPGYLEKSPRLRRLPLGPSSPASLLSEGVLVCLPSGYEQSGERRYPTLYIHDGKDAIVRGRYDRLLDKLAMQGAVPQVVAVFIAAPSDATARLAAFSHYPDPAFPEVKARGAEYADLLFSTVLPQVERRYRTSGTRAMLGIDLAGPWSFQVVWNDTEKRFSRVASQSGRFGWGSAMLESSPYMTLLKRDASPPVPKLAVDWSDGDQYQAQVHDALKTAWSKPGYAGKVLFTKQDPLPAAFWDGLRTRAESSVTFLLSDLK